MRRIILASTSKRREELLKLLDLKFEVIPSSYEEDMSLELPPEGLVKTFALGKAKDVAKKEKGVIIGVDTIVVHDKKNIGKPKDSEDAKRMLKKFSGKEHHVYSGIAIIDTETGNEIVDHEVTKVFLREMSDEEIDSYVATKEPLDKAGAYGIQGIGSIFVSRVEGCYFNVVGLPLANLEKNLRILGINIFEYEKVNRNP
ncbi:MAG: Maf family protein [Candidatus Woesearchaeota archaeon]